MCSDFAFSPKQRRRSQRIRFAVAGARVGDSVSGDPWREQLRDLLDADEFHGRTAAQGDGARRWGVKTGRGRFSMCLFLSCANNNDPFFELLIAMVSSLIAVYGDVYIIIQ